MFYNEFIAIKIQYANSPTTVSDIKNIIKVLYFCLILKKKNS